MSWTSVRTIARSLVFRFRARGLCGAHLLKFSNRFKACSPFLIELKLVGCWDNTRHQSAQLLAAGFLDFPLGGAVGLRLSKYFKRFTAYSFRPIELELDKMLRRHQTAQSFGVGFSDFPRGRYCGVPLEIFKSIRSSQ